MSNNKCSEEGADCELDIYTYGRTYVRTKQPIEVVWIIECVELF